MDGVLNMTDNQIRLFVLNLTLTLRCTLRCKLCVAEVPKYKVLPHFSKEHLFDVIDRCFSIIDYIERFQFSGGEPLLHEDFNEIIQRAMRYSDQYGHLGVFANGTILPNQDTIDTIVNSPDKEKFKFYISHYGDLSSKAAEMEKLLLENGIPYEIKSYHGSDQHSDGWIDYGNYRFQDYSTQELTDVFHNCAVYKMGGCWSCRFGEIHRCTRSVSGMHLKATPRVQNDYIDLFSDLSITQQRQRLRNIEQQPFVTACAYCTGDFGTDDKSRRYPAAEQI